jgi:hypothetical protein
MEQSELRDQILRLERRIEELSTSLERSRKVIVISKLSIAAGGVLASALVLGAISVQPLVVVAATAAIFGGIVGFGANVSTIRQDTSAMQAAETLRAELISNLELREIGSGTNLSLHR